MFLLIQHNDIGKIKQKEKLRIERNYDVGLSTYHNLHPEITPKNESALLFRIGEKEKLVHVQFFLKQQQFTGRTFWQPTSRN